MIPYFEKLFCNLAQEIRYTLFFTFDLANYLMSIFTRFLILWLLLLLLNIIALAVF